MAWCQEQISKGDKFLNVIRMDECLVQLDNYGHLCLRRKKEKRKLKPRPKHPLKLHVWAGISAPGASYLQRILTATRYCEILQEGLLPFIEDVFPADHRFQMDNDPKHCSKYTKKFLVEKVNWRKTPAESPDLNPIENT